MIQNLIIAIGNAIRGDDAVGIQVVSQLSVNPPLNTIFMIQDGEMSDLILAWEDAHTVYLIDAMQSGGIPGDIRLFEAHREPLPAVFNHTSSHSFGVSEAIEMSRLLKTLPNKVIVYGIEAAQFDIGAPLSPAVAAAVPMVVEEILTELGG